MNIYYQGLILTVIGMGIVFLFLSIVAVVIKFITYFIRPKNILIKNVPAKKELNLKNLEKIAVIIASIEHLKSAHSSLVTNKNSNEIMNEFRWKF